MSEPITDLETAVRELGALPMPAGPVAPLVPQRQSRTMLDHARDALNARMTKDDLRLVLENVVTYAASLETRLAERERPVDEDPIRFELTPKAEQLRAEDDVTPQVRKLRALLAGQRAQTGGAQ